MTTKELNFLKNKLLAQSFNSLDVETRKAEELLINAIIDEARKLVVDGNGKLISSNGNITSINLAVERAFQLFRKGPQLDIVKNMLKSFDKIGALNENYFRSSQDDAKKYESFIDKVESNLKKRIGITTNGNLIKNGFLYNLVNDSSIQAAIQAAAQKGIVANLPFKDYMEMLRVNIKGNAETLPGPVTQHYRTFAHDAYMIYDSAYAAKVAEDLELRYFVYEGGLIELSREFCRRKDGLIFTREEAEFNWPNDPTLLKTKQEKESGVLNYNPIEDRGRWNCRHHLNWIVDPKIIANEDLRRAKLAS